MTLSLARWAARLASRRSRALFALLAVLVALLPCERSLDFAGGKEETVVSAAPESGDESDAGAPCAELCTCLRCPGHGVAVPEPFAFDAPMPPAQVAARHGFELSWTPRGIPPGIFHPPRSA